jgi:hypothetical protein
MQHRVARTALLLALVAGAARARSQRPRRRRRRRRDGQAPRLRLLPRRERRPGRRRDQPRRHQMRDRPPGDPRLLPLREAVRRVGVRARALWLDVRERQGTRLAAAGQLQQAPQPDRGVRAGGLIIDAGCRRFAASSADAARRAAAASRCPCAVSGRRIGARFRPCPWSGGAPWGRAAGPADSRRPRPLRPVAVVTVIGQSRGRPPCPCAAVGRSSEAG